MNSPYGNNQNQYYLYNSYCFLFKFCKFNEVFIWSKIIYLYFFFLILLEYHTSEISFQYEELIPVMFPTVSKLRHGLSPVCSLLKDN